MFSSGNRAIADLMLVRFALIGHEFSPFIEMFNQRQRNERLTAPADWAERSHVTSLTNLLLLVVDFALGGVIFLAPLFMGGRHPAGRLVYVVLAVVAAVAWLLRQCLLKTARWTRSPADWLVLAGVVVIGVQILPLPAPALNQSLSQSV